MRFRLTGLIVAATAQLVFAAQAKAGPVFTADVDNIDSGVVAFESGALPVDTLDVQISSTLGLPQFTGRGVASRGIVQARGINESIHVQGLSNGRNAGASGTMTLTDVQITGPVGINSVQASLNFRVDGEMSTIGAEPNAAVAVASVDVQVSQVGGGLLTAGQKIYYGNNIDPAGTGIFSGFGGSIHGDFTTPLFTLGTLSNPVDFNNGFQFSLVITTGAGNGTSAYSDFLDGGGLHFPTSGPVFNLPPGFTANSASGLIVDNHWMGVVPEPSSALLALIAATGLAMIRFRRRVKP